MQQKCKKTQLLAKAVGEVIKESRLNKNLSINRFANEYDLDIGNTSRVEKGSVEVKFVTLWKISEALGISPDKLVSLIMQKLGHDFHFYDE